MLGNVYFYLYLKGIKLMWVYVSFLGFLFAMCGCDLQKDHLKIVKTIINTSEDNIFSKQPQKDL